MKSEMSYKFKGSGHEVPEEKRKYQKPSTYKEPSSELKKTFEKWLESCQHSTSGFDAGYDQAKQVLNGIDAQVAEAHGLLIAYQKIKNIEKAGFFVSAIYNKAPDKEIVFDLSLEKSIQGLGYELAEGKTLVNTSKRVASLGEKSSGHIINLGSVEDLAKDAVKGLYINEGEATYFATLDVKDGIYVNKGEAECFASGSDDASEGYGPLNGTFLNFGVCGDAGMGFTFQGGVLVNLKEAKKFADLALGGFRLSYSSIEELSLGWHPIMPDKGITIDVESDEIWYCPGFGNAPVGAEKAIRLSRELEQLCEEFKQYLLTVGFTAADFNPQKFETKTKSMVQKMEDLAIGRKRK